MAESLFIIDLHYLAALEELDSAMASHVAFLDKHYEAGHFITSGRKVPRTGGIILAVADSKQEAESWMNEDPFVKLRLSNFTVTEFLASKSDPAFKKLLKDLNRKAK